MRIKLDENIPLGLAALLSELGHDVDTVPQENLSGEDDDTVWDGAQGEKRLLITQDLDFSDLRRFQPGTHYGVLLVRFRSPGRLALTRKIYEVFSTEATADWEGCFLVLSDLKLRVRRPNV